MELFKGIDKMKMSKELYSIIDSEISRTIQFYGDKKIKEIRNTVKYANSQYISFCGAMFYLAITTEIIDLLDQEDLQDSHIETALKQILIDYK